MLREKLYKAYPFRGRFKESFKAFVFISCFIAAFVFLFRSDDIIPDLTFVERLMISMLYGLITFAGASLNTVFIWLFISQKAENNWNVIYEILLYLLHFFTISVLLYVLHEIITDSLIDFRVLDLVKSFSRTVIIGIIPVSIHVLMEQNKLYKKYYKQGLKLESERKSRAIVEQEDLINIPGHSVPVAELIFVESNKNYLYFFTIANDPIIVRMTLKVLEEKLADYPQFIRTHRAYIVNLDKVLKVEGNAQGLRLTMKDHLSIIPVSRSYIPSVADVLSLK